MGMFVSVHLPTHCEHAVINGCHHSGACSVGCSHTTSFCMASPEQCTAYLNVICLSVKTHLLSFPCSQKCVSFHTKCNRMQSTLREIVFVLAWLNLGWQNPFPLQHVSQLLNHLDKKSIYSLCSCQWPMETKAFFHSLIQDLNVSSWLPSFVTGLSRYTVH